MRESYIFVIFQELLIRKYNACFKNAEEYLFPGSTVS